MPQNLDDFTRSVILAATILAVVPLSCFNIYLQYILIPRKQAILAKGKSFTTTSCCIIRGSVATILIMMTVSYVLLMVSLIFLGTETDEYETPIEYDVLPSSINFCEQDFVDNKYIAEPANSMSSLSFCALALLGLFLRPTTEFKFALAYVSLFVIGLGSFFLHAMLTATAQSGDELPMLWYVAIMCYITMDCILKTKSDNNADLGSWRSKILAAACTCTSISATIAYVQNREYFVVFYIMFSMYCVALLFGLLYLVFSSKIDEKVDTESFHSNISFPMLNCVLWIYVLAVVSWVSEMLYCHDATIGERWGTGVVPWFWNRVIHPTWHCTIAFVAFEIIQALIAINGVQRGWGQPELKWFGVPYVKFTCTREVNE